VFFLCCLLHPGWCWIFKVKCLKNHNYIQSSFQEWRGWELWRACWYMVAWVRSVWDDVRTKAWGCGAPACWEGRWSNSSHVLVNVAIWILFHLHDVALFCHNVLMIPFECYRLAKKIRISPSIVQMPFREFSSTVWSPSALTKLLCHMFPFLLEPLLHMFPSMQVSRVANAVAQHVTAFLHGFTFLGQYFDTWLSGILSMFTAQKVITKILGLSM